MKIRHIIAAAALSVLCACGNGQVEYLVSATGAEDGTVLTLNNKLTGEILETQTSTEGSAVFHGYADKDALLYVQVEGSKRENIFFADGEPISIDLESSTLLGSELNEDLNALDLEAAGLYASVMATVARLYAAPEEEQEKIREEIDAQSDALMACYKKILEENRDNIIPAAFISEIAGFSEEEELDDLFNTEYAYANHPFAKAVKQRIDEYKAKEAEAEALRNELIGKPFIDIEEPDVDGNMHKLSEFVGCGKWVFIDFWASWCGPCRREMPNVVAAYEKYHPLGLEIVGLSFDKEKDPWVKAIKDLKMPWIHLSDLKYWGTVAAEAYGIRSIPSSVLVNPEGIVVARDLRGDALGEKLAEIFGE